MLEILLSCLADRFDKGDRLQRPDLGVKGYILLGWIGGFLEVVCWAFFGKPEKNASGTGVASHVSGHRSVGPKEIG